MSPWPKNITEFRDSPMLNTKLQIHQEVVVVEREVVGPEEGLEVAMNRVIIFRMASINKNLMKDIQPKMTQQMAKIMESIRKQKLMKGAKDTIEATKIEEEEGAGIVEDSMEAEESLCLIEAVGEDMSLIDRGSILKIFQGLR